MLKPRIFISHSAKDPFAADVRDQLFTALEAAGFDPFLDKKRLHPGVDWNNELHTWLGLCHGGVILFSDDAFTSDWVLKETTILTYRRALDANFPILPVLLPGIEIAKLQVKPFAALDVSATQAFMVDATSAASASDFVTRCVDLLAPLRAQLSYESPLQRAERKLVNGLNQIERSSLEGVAGALKLELPPWQPDESYTQAFVRSLFHQEVSVIKALITELAPFPSMTTAFLSDMLEILLTVYIIDPSLVSPIPAVVRRKQHQRRNLAVNARFVSTGEMLIQRACWFDPNWKVMKVNNKAGTDASGHLISELREWGVWIFGVDASAFDSDDEFYDYLDERIASAVEDAPVIVLLPEKIANANLAPSVRARYPGLTFFLLRASATSESQSQNGQDIELLAPFQHEQEESLVTLRSAAQTRARTMMNG